jgi:hypothetical protein
VSARPKAPRALRDALAPPGQLFARLLTLEEGPICRYRAGQRLEPVARSGEGSTPVPLPPPTAISDFEFQSARSAHSSPNGPFLSGALDSADSVRFSKFKCFARLTNAYEVGFCTPSRTGENNRVQNRHIEVRYLLSQPSSHSTRESGPLLAKSTAFDRVFVRLSKVSSDEKTATFARIC